MVRKAPLPQISNEFFYCVCSGSLFIKDPNYKPLICKTCTRKSHKECTRFTGDESHFECLLCKVHLLDPFNTVEDFLWYECIGNTSSFFVVDARNLRKWRSSNKDVFMVCIPLNKEKLQHEWPKTFQLKINNDLVHVVKEPSWEHKRRDNPIKITYAMRTGENLVNISSTTYKEGEPLFLLMMFLSKHVSVDNIIDFVKKNYTIPFDEARNRIHSIVNAKIDDDEIMCMENTHKMDLNCPVTLDKIVIPTRGRYCGHIQCYDLTGYLKVMERTSAFNMRWRCPECHLIVKPYDLVIDTFVERIIHELPNAKTIELDKELNYRILVDSTTPTKTINKSQSDDEKCLDLFNSDKNLIDNDQLNDESLKLNSLNSSKVIELESDEHNVVIFDEKSLDKNSQNDVEIICISDDDPLVDDLKNSKKTKTKKVQGSSRGRPSKSKNNFDLTNQSFDHKKRRKLKKPQGYVDYQDSILSIPDSQIAECVTTFNQQRINTFSNSTPTFENFILNPPIINELNNM